MSRLLRSLIFVPGNNPRFINKARSLNADIICLDLEDSVPEDEKSKARELIYQALDEPFNSEVYVRVNSPSSQFIDKDLRVIREGLSGIVIPKVDDEEEVVKISDAITKIEKEQKIKPYSIEMMPSIESAKGVVNAYNIAKASSRVVALVFGVFDLLHDLGVEYDENDYMPYLYSRAKVPIDARAAGVYAIDSIWQKIEDKEGLIKDARFGMRLGYKGKSIIHPSQIEPVHEIFKPSKEEIEWARKVINALDRAKEEGKGAIRLEGKMIDKVHYKRAKALLDVIDDRDQ
ncbi:MAG: CoA ester lyase [Candidatus Nitrosothermus koennekii]|nr:MAG: CoA ester lyase [Candidatus Nitrosothermus koennekii]